MKNWRQFVFYDNKLSNCQLSLVDTSYKLKVNVSVRLLTMKISQWARENFCCYRKNTNRVSCTPIGFWPHLKSLKTTALASSNSLALKAPHSLRSWSSFICFRICVLASVVACDWKKCVFRQERKMPLPRPLPHRLYFQPLFGKRARTPSPMTWRETAAEIEHTHSLV